MSAALYDWLLFGHIVAAMIWLGGAVLLGAVASTVLRSPDPDLLGRFLAGLRYLGPRLLAPATVAVLGLGIWLVLNAAAWGFDQLWVQLAVGLLLAAFLIGAAHQSRTALAAERAHDRGDHDEALRQLRRWSWGYWLIVGLLIAATWDMVNKPGL